jgi:ABC-type amino acid transport system permease subunit
VFAGVHERERLHEPADHPDVRVRHAVLANEPIVRIEVVQVVRVVVVIGIVVVVIGIVVENVVVASKAEKASREQTKAFGARRVRRDP